MPHETLEAKHAHLLPPTRPVDAALETAGLSMWSTHPALRPGNPHQAHHTPTREPLPYLGTHPDTVPFRVHKGIPGRGMLYVSDTSFSPSAEVREALMGVHIGDTAAPGLSALQRVQLLGQCTDLNTLAWTLSIIRSHAPPPAEHDPRVRSLRRNGLAVTRSPMPSPAWSIYPSSLLEGFPHSCWRHSRRQYHIRGTPCFDPNSGCT